MINHTGLIGNWHLWPHSMLSYLRLSKLINFISYNEICRFLKRLFVLVVFYLFERSDLNVVVTLIHCVFSRSQMLQVCVLVPTLNLIRCLGCVWRDQMWRHREVVNKIQVILVLNRDFILHLVKCIQFESHIFLFWIFSRTVIDFLSRRFSEILLSAAHWFALLMMEFGWHLSFLFPWRSRSCMPPLVLYSGISNI